MKPITIEGFDLYPVFLVTEDSPFDASKVTGQIARVLDAGGWMVYNRSVVSEALVRLDPAPLTGLTTPFVRPTKKIPVALLHNFTAFARAVNKEHQAECMAYIYHNAKTGDWDMEPPRQVVSYSDAKQDDDLAPMIVGDGGEFWKIVASIHSHGDMSAFHSPTDDKDERFRYGYHITIGNVDRNPPSYACSLVFQGRREKLEPEDVFDGLKLTGQFPADWLARVSKRSYGVTTYHGHGVTAHTYDDDKVDCHVSRRDQRPAKGNGKAGDDTASHVGFHSR